jgi:flagellar hook-length control protein FliK
MKIIDMVNGKFTSITQPTPSTQNNTGFDMLLAEAGRRQSFDPTVEHQGRSRDDGRRNRTDETRREEPPMRRRQNIQPAEDVTSTAATAAVQEQTTHDEVNETYAESVDEEQAIEKVAEVMQVPVEIVMEWLDKAELKPQDLTDTQAVAKMLQYALDAETPAELLTDPKFPENYKAVNEAMTEIAVKAKPNAAVKTEAQVSEEALAVLEEEIEATIEDGEVVVQSSTNNSRTQSETQTASQATTQTAEQADKSLTGALGTEAKDATLLNADEAVVNEQPTINPALNFEATTAKAEQIVRQAAAPQPVNTTNVIEQIMNQVKISSAGGNFTEIRMTLRPESLGDIVLRVITQNGIVTAQFEAESQRVKEALEADFNRLRNALEEQGIKFSELSVSVRQDGNERMNQFEHARQNSRHRAQSIEDVSEIEAEVPISHHNGVIDLVG